MAFQAGVAVAQVVDVSDLVSFYLLEGRQCPSFCPSKHVRSSRGFYTAYPSARLHISLCGPRLGQGLLKLVIHPIFSGSTATESQLESGSVSAFGVGEVCTQLLEQLL